MQAGRWRNETTKSSKKFAVLNNLRFSVYFVPFKWNDGSLFLWFDNLNVVFHFALCYFHVNILGMLFSDVQSHNMRYVNNSGGATGEHEGICPSPCTPPQKKKKKKKKIQM